MFVELNTNENFEGNERGEILILKKYNSFHFVTIIQRRCIIIYSKWNKK